MAETTASELAKYVIAASRQSFGDTTNLKLQKLLYYAQAWHLGLHGEPLFDDRIEAWVHGPVVPNVFREYRDWKWSPLPVPDHIEVPESVSAHANEVLTVFGNLSAWDLERMSHNEDPWRDARGNLPPDAPSNAEITHEAMKKFFGA